MRLEEVPSINRETRNFGIASRFATRCVRALGRMGNAAREALPIFKSQNRGEYVTDNRPAVPDAADAIRRIEQQ